MKSELEMYKDECEYLRRRLDHLLESKFIKSFDMKIPGGRYQRDISECDNIIRNAVGRDGFNDTKVKDGGLTVKVNVDTTQLDMAIEKAKELNRLMEKLQSK